ncbi:YALI0C23224p [Yarrowia lipolytica CLIB122]|uniref:YALI0C23224p n=2 Tax=Yarrowia lipolytica TaxID=4952 RepID=Q6CAZ1_YARLI|nr:YALI0C23224p [Yarrowia lipolytica CLIB122]AOW03296.1 hypothetical protein YALI1_C32034g [Yarrowia lipolytica]KAB8280301.1 Alpha/Beta hydrolase protein [Yarrowia lipolytica]KAE8170250.1 Alpha/Beta hydrolase protein [Yarrowia lipolytica]KAJ8053778.1 Alpha/Beta hydrolase protein [Yarrowia lipolytica]RMI96224.1 Alpha/Beta hydrolase protein [Yarrowia lipolytica]|eukprot:XP_502171.2 YALI0C23224p [Yarrowia lipolytica CLIB122]
MSSLDLSYYEPFHRNAVLNGKRWHYVDIPGDSSGSLGRGKTLLLVHGFPDTWYGWRHQVPVFRKHGFRLLIPSLLGFPRSEAPLTHPGVATGEKFDGHNVHKELGLEDENIQELECYTADFFAKSMVQLLDQLGIDKVCSFGHDWGAVFAPRLWLNYPERVECVSSACWYYQMPMEGFVDLKDFAEVAPSLRYQLYWGGDAPQEVIQKPLKEFMDRMYHHPTENHLLTSEAEYNNILKEFQYGGKTIAPMFPLYKSRKLAYDIDERDFLTKGRTEEDLAVDVPYLFIGAEFDIALQPGMESVLEGYVKEGLLEKQWVPCGHWVLFEEPEKMNKIYIDFLKKVFGSSKL